MGDLREDYKAFNDAKRERKRLNNERAVAALMSAGVSFVEFNDGSQLRFDNRVDYWPSTGTWLVLRSTKRGHGVQSLMRYLGVDLPLPERDPESVPPIDSLK